MTCVSCGHELDDRARYCSQCGLPVAGLVSFDDGTDDRPEPTLISPIGSLGHEATAERAAIGGGGSRPILAVVSVTLIGLLFWSIFRTPTQSLDGIAQPLTEIGSGDDGDEATIEVAPSDSKSRVQEQPKSVGSDSRVEVPTVRPPEIIHLDGHYVFAGNQSQLARIDIDTGDVDIYESNGQIVGHYNDELILFHRTQGLMTVPIDNPGMEPSVVFELDGVSEIFSIRSTLDGQVEILFWDFAVGPGAPESGLVEVDLNTGTAQHSRREEDFWRDQFGVRWVPGGGLFEATDDGYRFLHAGISEVVGPRYVLVRSCDEPDSCRRTWIERRSRAPIARPLPPEDVWVARSIDEDSRLLALESESGPRYYDVVNERYLPSNIRPNYQFNGGPDSWRHPESMSPDGRYMVLAESTDGIVFYRLADQHVSRIDLDIQGRVEGVLVVPKPE